MVNGGFIYMEARGGDKEEMGYGGRWSALTVNFLKGVLLRFFFVLL